MLYGAKLERVGVGAVSMVRATANRRGYAELRRFAARWPSARWAIEGASGMGAPLASWLARDGIIALDVPAKLATRVRVLSTGHGRKNDNADAVSVGIAALADAVSVGIAALTASGLRRVAVEDTVIALRALVEHRDDVVRTRTQTVNRLHVLLTSLLPGGAPRELNADTAAHLLRTVRPRSSGPATLRQLAAELIAEIRHLDRRIMKATKQISAAVAASRSTLPKLSGIGDLTAAKVLARVGDISRFTLRGRVRLLYRHRAYRRLIRRRYPTPTLAGGRSPTELLPPRHGDQSSPQPRSRPRLLPAPAPRR